MPCGRASRRNAGRPRQVWAKRRPSSPSLQRPRRSRAQANAMDLYRRSVALYGRFSPGQRDRLRREITQRGGLVARDLTRRSEVLVIGSVSTALIDSGALMARIRMASSRRIGVWGERSFAAAISE